MGHPSNGLTGAVVSVYIAGEALGALTQTFIGDRLGRIRFMQLECILVTIGCTIQTASVNIGMFLAGRALAGYAVGYVSISPIKEIQAN
jgi:MFS family permease